MTELTIHLPNQQYQALQTIAKQQKESIDILISRYLTQVSIADTESNSAIMQLAGIAEGTGEPIGKDHDVYLYGQSK
jgi:hypothetical protein